MTDAQPALVDICHCPPQSITYGMMRAGILHHSLLILESFIFSLALDFKILRDITEL